MQRMPMHISIIMLQDPKTMPVFLSFLLSKS